ncbi:sodium channel protein type 4 subunit alpha B-like isoform X2 [Syngnathus acus]|uniref:sodium channel protein type 4 subunit alpha B-like isoform X2 n=1 Tax=Syngnathus acus TaxID=161584 RepID=UPI001885D1F7|nr:sodium channel protein type 4 subunit alpha B-like isoform X2 [Syngnathus acus]
MRRKTFWDIWGNSKEEEEVVRRAAQLKPFTSELKMLLGNGALRAQLENSKMVSLLPPVGTSVFRHFTPGSLKEIQRCREVQEKERQKREDKNISVTVAQENPAGGLESGKPLPFIFGDPSPEFVNTPLEDLDPFYQSQKVFIVLDGQKVIHRFNADPACYMLTAYNHVRTSAIKILLHSFFRAFILLTILTNCVFMTVQEPLEWTRIVKFAIIAIYAIEVLVKVAARGFCVGRFTFLRDPWNWLDLVIISTAYLAEIVNLGGLSRFLQVLPALKLIPAIPSVKKTLGALTRVVRKMNHVIALSLGCLIVLAALELHNFMSYLLNKCVLIQSSNDSYVDHINDGGKKRNIVFSFFLPPSRLLENIPCLHCLTANYYYLPGHTEAQLCGNRSSAGTCPDGFMCLNVGTNPNYGYTNFDSFGWAFLALLRLMTQDFWEDLFRLILHSGGKIYTINFLADILLASFSLGSLIVAVIAVAFVEQKQAETTEAEQRSKDYAEIVETLKKEEKVDGSGGLDEKPSSGVDTPKTPPVAIFGFFSNFAVLSERKDEQRPCSPCCSAFTAIFIKWTCCDGCRPKQLLHRVVSDPFFDLFVVMCLLLNITFMAMEHFPMTYQFADMLFISVPVFAVIFAVEVGLRFLATGPYFFFQVGWNIFDLVIAVITLLELHLVFISELSFTRLFCVMRVFRLARWWPNFNALLKLIRSSLGVLRRFTLLLLIIIFIFAAMGFRIFGRNYEENVCRISEDCSLPRYHMADFIHAFLLTFRVLCGEWIETMWDCMQVAGEPACLIFYATMVVVTKLALLNLFLALLIKSPNGDHQTASEVEAQKNLQEALNRIRRAVMGVKSQVLGHPSKKTGWKANLNPPGLKSDEPDQKEFLALTFVNTEEPESEVKTCDEAFKSASANGDADEENNHGDSAAGLRKPDDRDTPAQCFCDQCYRCCPVLNMDSCPAGLKTWSNWRRMCVSVVDHKYFEAFVTFVIFLSSCALAVEDIYLEKRVVLRSVLEYADYVFTCIFVLEMLLKWFAGGFKKYFTDAWCWLDFLVVLISLLSTFATLLGIPQLKAFTSLRTLRPLRLLSRFGGTKVVATTLFGVFPAILDVLLACLTLWLIFSIMGVNLFAGRFYSCVNSTWIMQDVNNKTECFMLMESNYSEVRWHNPQVNFDNVGMGFLSLLHVATVKGWLDLMASAMDSKEVESQPEYEANMFTSLYFVFFIILGSFFTFNFLISTIIEHLKWQKAKLGATGIFMTQDQMTLYDSLKAFSQKKTQRSVPRPQNKIQGLLFDLVTKDFFDIAFTVVACIQVLVLMVGTRDESMEKIKIIFWIDFAIIVIFTAECVLKLIALRRHYFAFGWNIFDFVLVVLFILGLFLEDVLNKYFILTHPFFSVIRLARTFRVLHLFRFAKGVRRLLYVLMRSLPALFNIGLFLFLIMFTFCVFGMQHFAYVKKRALMDDVFNFETFGNAFICMFTMTTLAGWDGLLLPIISEPPDCDPYLGNCGRPVVGILFLTSYVIMSFLVVVNMYIVVILEKFNMAAEESIDELCEMFYDTWERFDPHASGLIHSSQLSDFCDSLKEPLRIAKPNGIKVSNMDLPLVPEDKIHYLDLLLALTAQVQGMSGERDKLKASMEEKFKARHQAINKREDDAAIVIQRAYRKHAAQSPVQTGAQNGDVEA